MKRKQGKQWSQKFHDEQIKDKARRIKEQKEAYRRFQEAHQLDTHPVYSGNGNNKDDTSTVFNYNQVKEQMAKYIDIEKEITEMQQVVEFYKDTKTPEAETTSFAFQAIIDKLKQIPAADVAPVIHAHWVDHMGKRFLHAYSPDYELVYDGGFNCSNCNHYEDKLGKNYCPNCGAKMDNSIKINYHVNFKNCETKMDEETKDA